MPATEEFINSYAIHLSICLSVKLTSQLEPTGVILTINVGSNLFLPTDPHGASTGNKNPLLRGPLPLDVAAKCQTA
tara:strand:- start:395 stop:622 length:228 start_codon:yes stop_codon:yes gene_type:complete